MRQRLIVFLFLFALALGGFWASEQFMFNVVRDAKQAEAVAVTD